MILIKKIMKKSLNQINEIDNDIKNNSRCKNPIFESFDQEIAEDIKRTNDSIEKIKKSIHSTKQ